jgi:glycerol-3-phosphate acyltransferase PlsY
MSEGGEDSVIKALFLMALCYLIGSIPFSLIFGMALGKVDIRTRGSGNIGATNVLRTSGIAVALLALAADLCKGLAAAWIGTAAGGPVLAALCAAAVITGHCYSIFLNFKGGKGVATAAGIIAFLMPNVFVVVLIIFISMVTITRYVSMGSVIGAISFPLLTAFVFPQPLPYIIMSIYMIALVLYRHKDNLIRLKDGKESKITDRF